jgi:hypothetical protein
LFKPLWLVFILLPVLYIGQSRQMNRSRSVLILLVAWMLPLAAMVGWFAWHGALNDLVEVHLKYSALYASLASDDRLKNLAQYFLSARVITVLLPVSVYGLVVLWRDRRPAAVMFLAWVAITIVLVTAQGRFYAYHWLPMLPALSVLAALGLRDVSRSARPFAQIVAAVALLSCAGTNCSRIVEIRGLANGRHRSGGLFRRLRGTGAGHESRRVASDHGSPRQSLRLWLSLRCAVVERPRKRFAVLLRLAPHDGNVDIDPVAVPRRIAEGTRDRSAEIHHCGDSL